MPETMIPAIDPCLFDVKGRRVIYVRCSCGHEARLVPAMLVGKHGIQWHTKVFGLRNHLQCTKCRRRPERVWIDKWRD